MANEIRVPVYDEEGKVIARVAYNKKLDFWDGHNWTCGSTGRHLGYTRLKSGKYVLIHGTQWQGERNHAEVVSPERLVQEAARAGRLDELYEDFPELREIKLPDEEEDIERKEKRIINRAVATAFGNGAHITVPKELIGKTITYYVD